MKDYEPSYYRIAKEGGEWNSFPRKEVLDFLNSNLKKDSNVLEIGCGTAEVLNFLRDDIRYTGVEQSLYALGEAKKKWAERQGLFFMRGEAESISSTLKEFNACPDGGFDLVLMLYTLEHLHNPQKALVECDKILRKGGYLILLAPNFENPLSWPGALRHKSVFFRIRFAVVRIIDYIKKLLGIYSFRLIKENFSDATGRYEKKDDDLRYVVSAHEVISFLNKLSIKLHIFWSDKNQIQRPYLKFLPAMRWHGMVLAAVFLKDFSGK